MNTVSITTTDKISKQRLVSLLVAALEGGSNYWYMITDQHYPATMSFKDEDGNTNHPAYAILNRGGYVVFKSYADDEDGDEVNGKTEWRLDLDGVRKAMNLMANASWKGVESFKDPKRFWRDFVNENEDAETGDVFLQIALFGEVVFG